MTVPRRYLMESLRQFLAFPRVRRGAKLTCVLLVLHMATHLWAVVTATRETRRLGLDVVDGSFVGRSAVFVVGVPVMLYFSIWLFAFLVHVLMERRRQGRLTQVSPPEVPAEL